MLSFNIINILYFVGILSIPFASGLVSAATWWVATRRVRMAVATLTCMAAFMLLDLAMFKSLPMLGLSFGSPRIPVLSMSIIRGTTTAGIALLLLAYLAGRFRLSPDSLPLRSSRLYWAVPLSANLAISGALADGLFVEPLSIEVSQVDVVSNAWGDTAPPLRIVQLSDTHIERLTRRERDAVELIASIDPDLILMTGDYLNLSYLRDPQARDAFRAWASQLQARYGIYAVWGNTDFPSWRDRLLEGVNIIPLEDRTTTIEVNGQDIRLTGITVHQHLLDRDRRMLSKLATEMPDDGFNILLYHTPDLMPETVDTGKIDLYLAGHTHGGQIRVPHYGALVTASIYGKRYEAGYYEDGRTKLYVSRGLGFEGGVAPRIRFFCRPEITVITVHGEQGGTSL